METEIGAQFIERELRTDGDDRPVLIMKLATLDKPLEGVSETARVRAQESTRTLAEDCLHVGVSPDW